MEQVGLLTGGWKDGCGASGNIGWRMEGWLWSKWEYWQMDGRMVLEQVGLLVFRWKDGCAWALEQVEILAGGRKYVCGSGGNIGWWIEG